MFSAGASGTVGFEPALQGLLSLFPAVKLTLVTNLLHGTLLDRSRGWRGLGVAIHLDVGSFSFSGFLLVFILWWIRFTRCGSSDQRLLPRPTFFRRRLRRLHLFSRVSLSLPSLSVLRSCNQPHDSFHRISGCVTVLCVIWRSQITQNTKLLHQSDRK